MADALKLIIPLMDDDFRLSDFTSENGFIDGYLEDINRPSLVDHIFLLYDGEIKTPEQLERDSRFRSFSSLYSRKTIYIQKKPYLLYTFVNLSKEIRHIKEGEVPYKNELFKKIQLFWKLTDDFIIELTCRRNIPFVTEGLIVPEEDFIPVGFDELNINEFDE